MVVFFFFFFQAEDGIRDLTVTGVQTCALPICLPKRQHTNKQTWILGRRDWGGLSGGVGTGGGGSSSWNCSSRSFSATISGIVIFFLDEWGELDDVIYNCCCSEDVSCWIGAI